MALLGKWNPTGKKITVIPNRDFRREMQRKASRVFLLSLLVAAVPTLLILALPEFN